MDTKNSHRQTRGEMLTEIMELLEQASYIELEIVHRIVKNYIKR